MSESSLIVCVYVLNVCVQSSEQEGLQSHVEENAVLQQQIHAKDRELTLKVCICKCNVVTDLLHVELQEEQLQSKDRELAQAQQQLGQKVNCHVTVM